MLFYMTMDHMPFTEQYGKLSSTKTKSSMQQKSAQKGPKKKRLGLRKTILKVFLNSFMEFFSRPDYPINNQLFSIWVANRFRGFLISCHIVMHSGTFLGKLNVIFYL